MLFSYFKGWSNKSGDLAMAQTQIVMSSKAFHSYGSIKFVKHLWFAISETFPETLRLSLWAIPWAQGREEGRENGRVYFKHRNIPQFVNSHPPFTLFISSPFEPFNSLFYENKFAEGTLDQVCKAKAWGSVDFVSPILTSSNKHIYDCSYNQSNLFIFTNLDAVSI